MHQFFVEDCQIGRKYVTITGNDVRHIRQVLRMRPGETIRISSLSGQSMFCSITEVTQEFVSAEIITEAPNTELPSEIILFQAIPKGDRMETVIEKTVELGVAEIIPVAMKYCVVKLDAKKAAAKQKRWKAIAETAAKQSKRSRIPELKEVQSFADACAAAKALDLCIVPYENARGMESMKGVVQQIRPGMRIGVFIGPEGGFADEEIRALEPMAEIVSLGKRILRTDTAAITMLSLLMTILESDNS